MTKNLEPFATKFGLSEPKVLSVVRALEKAKQEPSDVAIEAVLQLMADYEIKSATSAVTRYLDSIQSANQDSEDGQQMNGMAIGLKKIGQAHYQKAYGLYRDTLDHANAQAFVDAAKDVIDGDLFLDPESLSSKALNAYTNLEKCKSSGQVDFDFGQFGGAALPFFSGKPPIALNQSDPKILEPQTSEAQ